MHTEMLQLTSIKGRNWRLADANDRLVQTLMQQHALPELIARLLVMRGIRLEQATDFLNPTLRAFLPDPLMFKDMRVAAERLASAIISGESVAVFGDYDVDGATSSALLVRYMRALGKECIAYIPDRIKEGYGPNTAALLSLKNRGVTLVLTVDCGTLAFEPLSEAYKAGLDVVVIDHHQAEAKLPDCVALVNPNRLDESGAHRELAAVGVTFLLLVATQKLLAEDGFFTTQTKPDLLQLLDIVALGTVCDVVPLTGANRAFVAQGLKILTKRSNIGLSALMDIAGLNKPPTASTLGFLLGPRINAGGRVGRPEAGVELLVCDDVGKAEALARELNQYNAERKSIESLMIEEATGQAEADIVKRDDECGVIVVANHVWHPGIIGIVASRLKDRFARPTAVIALDGTGLGKASCRSVAGFDFGAAVIAATEQRIILQGGGHAMAAGFSIEESRLPQLQTFLNDRFAASPHDKSSANEMLVEATISTAAATVELAKELTKLAPFGSANPEPLIVLQHAKIVQISELNGGHIRLMVVDARQGGEAIAAIAFRVADTPLGEALKKSKGQTLKLLGRLELDVWQSREKVSFLIEDAALAN